MLAKKVDRTWTYEPCKAKSEKIFFQAGVFTSEAHDSTFKDLLSQ